MTKPEFSHFFKLSDLGEAPVKGRLEADQVSRQALAKRFDLPDISELTCEYQLVGAEEKISFKGKISADLEQRCAISGESFPVHMDEAFDIIFVPRSNLSDQEEIELSEDDCDIVEFEDGKIDLGEAVAQSFYLALEPYPRGPNADENAQKKGLLNEEEAGPFGALAALKDKLD